MHNHRILEKQIKKYLPENYLRDENVLLFLNAVNDYYHASDRDKKMSEHAFSISEKEYEDAVNEQRGTNTVLHNSIQKLKLLLNDIQPGQANHISQDTEDISEVINILKEMITKAKELDLQLSKHAKNLEDLDTINSIIQKNSSNASIMDANKEALLSMLDIFGADRVWLANPCDIEADTMNVILECVNKDYPAKLETIYKIKLAGNYKSTFDFLLNQNEELVLDFDKLSPHQVDEFEQYSIRASIYIALKPATGGPWLLGLHQCSHKRIWTIEERKLFKSISEKLTSSLNTLLLTDDLKKSEAKLLQQNAELQRINQELDKFVYSTSHDLRSPLTSVLGLIDITKGITEKETESYSYLEMMEVAIMNLDNVIKSILEYSKSSRLKKLNKTIDMAELYNSVISSLSYMSGIDKVRFNSQVDTSTLFISDQISISAIVKNLVTNAVKYRNDSGQPFINFRFEVNDLEGIITVEDNGIGIAESALAQVFDMFYRATTSAEGSGLGLYIVQQNIEKLKGSITLESKIGVGSKFIVRIPNELHSQPAPTLQAANQ